MPGLRGLAWRVGRRTRAESRCRGNVRYEFDFGPLGSAVAARRALASCGLRSPGMAMAVTLASRIDRYEGHGRRSRLARSACPPKQPYSAIKLGGDDHGDDSFGYRGTGWRPADQDGCRQRVDRFGPRVL